jgi:hypothetical protein
VRVRENFLGGDSDRFSQATVFSDIKIIVSKLREQSNRGEGKRNVAKGG